MTKGQTIMRYTDPHPLAKIQSLRDWTWRFDNRYGDRVLSTLLIVAGIARLVGLWYVFTIGHSAAKSQDFGTAFVCLVFICSFLQTDLSGKVNKS